MVHLLHIQDDENEREEAMAMWHDDESEIRRMLQRASELCFLEGLFDGETKLKYQASSK